MMAASAPVGSLGPWKQNTDGDMYQVYKSRTSPKPRPTSSSPRYVRTWSQEEEAYLREARGARVPYKDIAARLNKTDLACRLHFHQMIVARKNSMLEESGVPTPPSEQYNQAMQYHHRSESLPPINTTLSPQILLPAPIIREPSRSGSGAVVLNPNHRRSISHPQTQGKRQPSPSPPSGGIMKQSPAPPSGRRPPPSNLVDLGRIQELYRDHAPTFWSNIAAAYSHDKTLSPNDIETAFFQGHGLGLTHAEPISPNSSAETSPASTWQSTMSINSHTSEDRMYSPTEHAGEKGNNTKFSVNSLLND